MASHCIGCELIERREAGNAPLWDNIYQTEYWYLVHANSTSLLGWLILITRRHIAAIDEMTEEEAIELGRLIRQVSIVLKDVTGCAKTYVAQFAESPGHQHVHFHIIPRMADQADEDKGLRIFKYLGLPESECVNEDKMDKLAMEVRRYFNST